MTETSSSDSLNLLKSSSFNLSFQFNGFDLNLSKDAMQMANQFNTNFESSLQNQFVDSMNQNQLFTNQHSTSTTAPSTTSSINKALGETNRSSVNTQFSLCHNSHDQNTYSNNSNNSNNSNTNANNPLLSCNSYNNDSEEDDVNWESLM